jgi:hypothetical protein
MFKQALFIMMAVSLLAVVAISIQTVSNVSAQEFKNIPNVIPICTGKGKTTTTPVNPVTPVSKLAASEGLLA